MRVMFRLLGPAVTLPGMLGLQGCAHGGPPAAGTLQSAGLMRTSVRTAGTVATTSRPAGGGGGGGSGGNNTFTNIAGMNAPAYAPTDRSTFMAVAPRGGKVAIAWLHNQDASGAFAVGGEPYTYVTTGNPTNPSSFASPQPIGQRMFDYASSDNLKYNSAHNAPFVIALPSGAFKALSVPNNANGYAEGLPATGYGYASSDLAAGTLLWTAPSLAPLADVTAGSSLSEMSGNADALGNIHLFGEGHLGAAQGGFAYQRLLAGAPSWETFCLASAYRPIGMNYFLEGMGYISLVKNASRGYDLHVAFAYNEQGSLPLFGLYYMVSHDGGSTWTTAAGTPVSLPLVYGDTSDAAAVIPAALGSDGSYSGSSPGFRVISVCATDTGVPVIVRPQFTDDSQSQVQHYVFTYVNGGWLSVPVGYPVFWNAAGTACAYNSATGKVNVLLLDPGSNTVPGKVLLYSETLADLQAGNANWTGETVATITNTSGYTSSLKACEVRNTRFEVLVEANYANPGQVTPVLLEAPMR